MIPCVLKESSRGYQSVPVEEMFFRDRTIFLTEEINTETCAGLIKQLLFLENEEPGKEIKLYINSPGGSITAGMAN